LLEESGSEKKLNPGEQRKKNHWFKRVKISKVEISGVSKEMTPQLLQRRAETLLLQLRHADELVGNVCRRCEEDSSSGRVQHCAKLL